MREACMRTVTHSQASQLLHNKFVVVLGDSIQRSVYKDLVLLLQTDSYLSLSQLKSKGELSFEHDCLVEGGRLGQMSNGTEYREVRQYRTDHHLVRFYFITRVFSQYMESVLADFKHDLKPDVVIVNSCVWDVSRYNQKWVPEYKENLKKFFGQLKAVLPEESLVVWNMTMPLGKKIIGGFLVPEIQDMAPTIRNDVIEANFYSAMLADTYGLDVLDLHFLFRFSLQHRMKDGIHWNALVHRQITCFLLAHAAQAWAVELPNPVAPDPGQKTCLLDSKTTSNQNSYNPIREHGQYGGKTGLLDYRTNLNQNPCNPMRKHGPYGGKTQLLDYRMSLNQNPYNPMREHDPYGGKTWLLDYRMSLNQNPYNPMREHGPYGGKTWLLDYRTTSNQNSYNPMRDHGPYGGGYNSYYDGYCRTAPAAPSWPGNNFVMRQKHTKHHYNPYARHNPIWYYRY